MPSPTLRNSLLQWMVRGNRFRRNYLRSSVNDDLQLILIGPKAMIAFPEVSPEIFSFSVAGIEFALRWYAVSYLAGFFVAIIIMKFFLRKESLWRFNVGPLERDQVDSMITYLILGVIIGGRIGYILFYNLDSYVESPMNALRIWDGGMAFHGGF